MKVPNPRFKTHECRKHCKNMIRNMPAGLWLKGACDEVDHLTELCSDISTTLIDYDGCETVESLKALIDEVRELIRKEFDCGMESITGSQGGARGGEQAGR